MINQPALFEPIGRQTDADNTIVRPNTSYWKDAWRRLKMNKVAIASLCVIIVIILSAIFGPFFCKYSYSDQSLLSANLPPSADHWFGTDNLGRDLFVRCLYGARVSLIVGFFVSLINLTLGVIYGGIAGYYGGKVDEYMMRIVDILYSIPLLLWVILLMVILMPGLQNVLIALGAVYWLYMARVVRGQVLSLKEQDYVLAARAIGVSDKRIILRHLVPNSIGPILVTVTFNIPEAIFTEAFLSFIGLGIGAPMASWGMLASDALGGFRSFPYQLFFPAISICITMLAFNFFGDGLRDALDPRLRK
ncbi:oligopeptide transport system permease protein [Hydrogenispora ethanolica]|jgi:oligopeptide transport system permease protein|uniref:Oligopeptide transport system permease protein n=1 Tax=Hydrogenispora ethanolica TaxID=1082276 RepID=A0A4R1RQ31_HYDET|nr:ABC transporter permease [Hydrogenispora ethanolica]TCL68493.1 oligopeptide transport system permease protein [Hydrogenispora ethanolica]